MLCRNGRDRANPWHYGDASAGFIREIFPAFSHYIALLPIVLPNMVNSAHACIGDNVFRQCSLTDKSYYTLHRK